MAKRLDQTDRNILAYRPTIRYIEPDIVEEVVEFVPEPVQAEDLREKAAQVKRLANAVNVLATATQSRADEKAKGMSISLDPKVDATTIQAMRRMFPDDDPTKITYEQYRDCKESMREKGEEIGKKMSISNDDIAKARDQAMGSIGAGGGRGGTGGGSTSVGLSGPSSQMGGFNTPEARNGGLRPELDPKSRIIDPIDMEETQNVLIRILVNYMWKFFIKPVIPIPPMMPGIPDKLCNIDKKMVGMLTGLGIYLPGEKLPKKQEPPEVPTKVEE